MEDLIVLCDVCHNRFHHKSSVNFDKPPSLKFHSPTLKRNSLVFYTITTVVALFIIFGAMSSCTKSEPVRTSINQKYASLHGPSPSRTQSEHISHKDAPIPLPTSSSVSPTQKKKVRTKDPTVNYSDNWVVQPSRRR